MAQDSASLPRAFATLPPTLRSVALGIAALGAAGVILASIAWIRPVETVVAADQAITSTVEFSYNAKVPPSPAYDGTVVTDPQPVFRQLADFVDVGFHYEGRPGTVRVDAELSTPGGWRSTMQLAEPVPFDGEQYHGTVRLDLTDIQARADAASAVTGLPASSVSVGVIPRVSLDEGGEIAPRLELILDAHALRLSGEDPLTVEDSVSVAGTSRQPATISVLGHGMDVTTLRRISVAVLTIASLLTAVLAVMVRRTRAAPACERIRRRYGPLILPVMPIALAPGRPVIDVPGVESLVRLAERYGLLVLYWSRSGVDTYVVQDEGTTYRYRDSHPTDASDQIPAHAAGFADAEDIAGSES